MEALFTINCLFLFFISIYKVHFLAKYFKLELVNPISIQFLVNFPITIAIYFIGPSVLLEDGLYDKYYNYAIFITSLSLICELIVIRSSLSFLKAKENYFRPILYSDRALRNRKLLLRFSAIFFMLFIVSFYFLSYGFGFINWIVDPRTGYQYYRAGSGHWFGLSITFLSISFVLASLSAESIRRIFVLFFAYLAISYFLGTKNLILMMSVYLMILLWYKRYDHLSRIFLIIMPVAFFGMLINFFSWGIEGNILISITSYFDHYKHSAMYFEAYFNDQIDLMGGKVFISSFWSLIPRSLFEEKPYVYGLLHVNEFFWPGAAEATNTPAFGGPIASFADFGIIGVILLPILRLTSIFEAYVLFILFKNRDNRDILNDRIYFYAFIFAFAPMLLDIWPFPFKVLLFIFIVIVIHFCGYRVWKRRTV
jgi:hypothetical protein